VRYVPPDGDANIINRADANFLEVFDASNVLLAQIKPLTSTSRYHAIAHGGTSVQGSSYYTALNGQPQWIDIRIAVGAQITIEFHVDGVLQSAATATNTTGKDKPRLVVFANSGLHGISTNRTWYYAHVAALDGVSTDGVLCNQANGRMYGVLIRLVLVTNRQFQGVSIDCLPAEPGRRGARNTPSLVWRSLEAALLRRAPELLFSVR
jgi:hypothetical protein